MTGAVFCILNGKEKISGYPADTLYRTQKGKATNMCVFHIGKDTKARGNFVLFYFWGKSV